MKRLSEYIYFVHSQHETQDKCILRGLLRQNPVIPPPWPLKIWEGWGGGTNCKTKSSNILDPEDRSTCICEDGTIIPPRTEGGGKKDNKRDN